MIRYITLILLLVLVAGLINGCADLGFPDLETQMRRREKARVEVDIKAAKLQVAKAKSDAKISEIRLLSEQRNNLIKYVTKHKDIEHKAILAIDQMEWDLQELAKQCGIKLIRDTAIPKANYKTVDSLLKKLRKERVKLDKDAPILVASFVNLDDLSESSTFGRVVAEQIASRFNQEGYTTIEMKLRTTVFIKEGSGEFLLSREMEEISIKHRAQAVVVGTYAVGSERIYLTARVVNVNDGRVLASYDYSISISRDVFKMLLKGKDKGKPDWL